MGGPSSIGFGHQPFGSEEFGREDWSEEVLWKIIPEFYRNLDTASIGLVPTPLRGFIDALKPSFQEIRDKLDIFPTLWDASECPFPQLPQLAYNVGITITSIETLSLVSILPAPFTIGEVLTGSKTGTTAFLSNVNQTTFTAINVRGIGFAVGETITGAQSGSSTTLSSITGVGGLSQTLTVTTFAVGETIKGSQTGTTGVIGSLGTSSINANTVTGTGFSNGEEITGQTSKATGIINGITSDGKTEQLLRSQVLNAVQLWTKKGTTKGYGIVAAFEGLFVLVTPLWAESCDPDPTGEGLTITPPASGDYLTYFDTQPADKLPMDRLFINEFDAWPRQVDQVQILPGLPESECRSYSLNLFFFTPDDTEIENFEAVAGRILNNIQNFKPLHVNFHAITFDGPHAASTKWLASPVIAESYVSSVKWSQPIIGSLSASSTKWNISNFTATNS